MARLTDQHGEDLADREEVRDHACEILVGLAQDGSPRGQDHDIIVEVHDGEGAPVYCAQLTLRGRWTAPS